VRIDPELYVSTLTARATTRPRTANEMAACTVIAIPRRQRHGVGRAERRGVRERQVEIVDETRPPVRGGDVGVHLLWEREVRMIGEPVRSRCSPSAVELPVERRECDVVRDPHDRSSRQQRPRLVGMRAPDDQLVDETGGGPQGLGDQHGHQAIEDPRSTDERFEILPGSPTMRTTRRAPSRIGSSKRGPSRSSLGSNSVRSIAASTAPAICQRASPTTGSDPPGSIPRSREPSFGGPITLV
jgi:hypothetical protein